MVKTHEYTIFSIITTIIQEIEMKKIHVNTYIRKQIDLTGYIKLNGSMRCQGRMARRRRWQRQGFLSREERVFKTMIFFGGQEW